MMPRLRLLLVVLSLAGLSRALDNGLSITPAM